MQHKFLGSPEQILPIALVLIAWSFFAGCGDHSYDEARSEINPGEAAVLDNILSKGNINASEVTVYQAAKGSQRYSPRRVGLREAHIVELTLHNAGIQDLTPTSKLPYLERLTLSSNQITSLKGLTGADRLVYLDLSENGLTSLASLPSLLSLKNLTVMNNKLTDLEPLPQLPALESLNVSGNELTTLAGLGFRPTLTSLFAERNKLTDLSGLDGVQALEICSFWKNQLSDVSKLSQLSKLRIVDLRENKLTTEPALSQVGEVKLEGNPIPEKVVRKQPVKKSFGKIPGTDIEIPPPPNPYVEKLPSSSGYVWGGLRCSNTMTTARCSGKIHTLSGHHIHTVGEGMREPPAVTVRFSVEKGKVRAYMPYYGVHQYVEATPGQPAELRGLLGPSLSGIGSYGLHLEAIGGNAEGVTVNMTPQ